MDRVLLACACSALLSLAMTSPTMADTSSTRGAVHLQQARASLAELDYVKARGSLQRALRSGNLDPASLIDVYRLSGQVAAAFGDSDRAFDQYKRMLALAPKATLGDGLAPKVVLPFERARTAMAGQPGLAIIAEYPGGMSMTVSVGSDSLSMVSAVVVVFSQPGTERRVRRAVREGRAIVRIPSEARRQVRIYARDHHGNDLVDESWTMPASAASAASPEPVVAGSEPRSPVLAVRSRRSAEFKRTAAPVYTRWSVWGIAALGSGAATIYFGRRAFADWDRLDKMLHESSSHSFDEARAMESRGRRNQLYANIAAGATVGLTAVATYWWFSGARADSTRRIVPAVTGDGASVAVRGAF